MQKSDFFFELPEALIAQTPAIPRDAARLMYLRRDNGHIEHYAFSDLPNLLLPGDLLVVNNSKVIPARLIGNKCDSGGVCEFLLLRENQRGEWECLARPAKRMRPGTMLTFGDGTLTAEILSNLPDGRKNVCFKYDTLSMYEKLDQFGKMPLPPYIRSQISANEDYQTVYAKYPGSSAAPTAGLHFTPELLRHLASSGINVAQVTLHVGLGTFRPVQADKIEAHEMHSEWYSIGEEAVKLINKTRANGHRVLAVGTTSCRVLESAAMENEPIKPFSGETSIFIYPGYKFKLVDGLITNFHLPESTLIMLVSAFCGRENTLLAYQTAINMQYRFFSFGDAMLII